MKKDLEEVKKLLMENNQEHIVTYLEKCKNQEALLEQLSEFDFAQLKALYETTKKPVEIEESQIEPIKYVDKNKLPKEEVEALEEAGRKVIRDGDYAVVTMAGGQGTRLGHKVQKEHF